MAGKDPELSRLGDALSEARAAYAKAKKDTDEAKAALNERGDCIQDYNAQISALRADVDAAYNAMRSERAGGDREAADRHRARARSLQEELTAKYEEKKQCFQALDEARSSFNEALDRQKNLRSSVQEAWDLFNARLEFLKEENAAEQARWKEKPCRQCGTSIRYNVEWKHIPSLCRTCYEKDRANWEDRTCTVCGSSFRINKTWKRIPSQCPACKSSVSRRTSIDSAVPVSAASAQ